MLILSAFSGSVRKLHLQTNCHMKTFWSLTAESLILRNILSIKPDFFIFWPQSNQTEKWDVFCSCWRMSVIMISIFLLPQGQIV